MLCSICGNPMLLKGTTFYNDRNEYCSWYWFGCSTRGHIFKHGEIQERISNKFWNSSGVRGTASKCNDSYGLTEMEKRVLLKEDR